MTKKVALLCLFLITAGANAINFTDNAVIKTAQNFLEQPGATLTDATVFIACASLAALAESTRDKDSNINNPKLVRPLVALSYPFFAATPWLIRGLPTYKWCAPFMHTLGVALFKQDKTSVLIYSILPRACGYAGLLAKNIITWCITK